jgi:hypothetical protein
MATRGGQISLPLAVGVDCGHPQWPDLFFLVGSPKRQIWPLRVAESLPLAVGVDHSHPQWPDLSFSFFFFFFFSAGKVTEGGSGWRLPSPEVCGGLFIWLFDLLVECFDFIFYLCIFLKLLRCQLMNGGQKTPPFCHDRMTAAPILIYILI